MLARKISCKSTLWLLFYIIDNSPSDDVGVGIPLGNLTSQIFANIYLHELDFFVKHTLRARRYVRYMDDFVIIHHDKPTLAAWRREIEGFLSSALRLKTNSKTQVFPVSTANGRALDFLGYRIYAHHRLLRKCTVKRIRVKLKRLHKQYATGEIGIAEVHQNIHSWLGHARHASTNNLSRALLSTPFRRDHV